MIDRKKERKKINLYWSQKKKRLQKKPEEKSRQSILY